MQHAKESQFKGLRMKVDSVVHSCFLTSFFEAGGSTVEHERF